jgi:hypothetical protein
MDFIAVPVDLIKSTPNDGELGTKVRELFFEHNPWTGVTEHHEPCTQETAEK